MKIINIIYKGIKSLLLDEKGNISSKRLVGLISSLTLCFTLISYSFSLITVSPVDSLINVIGLLAFGSLGLSSMDKYTHMREKIDEINKNKDNNAQY